MRYLLLLLLCAPALASDVVDFVCGTATNAISGYEFTFTADPQLTTIVFSNKTNVLLWETFSTRLQRGQKYDVTARALGGYVTVGNKTNYVSHGPWCQPYGYILFSTHDPKKKGNP